MSGIRSESSFIRHYLCLLAQRRFAVATSATGAMCRVMIDVAGDLNKYGTHTVILFTALSVLSLMSMVPFPHIGAILTMLLAFVIDIGPSYWVNSSFDAVLIVCASLILGHSESSHRWGFYFVMSTCAGMVALALWRLHTFEPFELILYGSLGILPWLMGRSLQRAEAEKAALCIRFELAKTTMRLEEQRRNMTLARRIHDSVTNDLSTILLMANSVDHEGMAISEQREIISHVRSALESVHQVIDLLNTNSNRRSEQDSVTLHKVVEFCHDKDAYLRKHGFSGMSTVMGDSTTHNDHMSLVMELLNELYANILRHCTPSVDEYAIVIRCGSEGLRLVQTNSCKDGVQHVQGLPSGKGLHMYRSEIETIGGIMHTSYEDGSWTLNCMIPA